MNSPGDTPCYDAIVVGSGIDGLTQTFSREGSTWDVGLHYLGEMAHGGAGET
jgi:hypothetical protein